MLDDRNIAAPQYCCVECYFQRGAMAGASRTLQKLPLFEPFNFLQTHSLKSDFLVPSTRVYSFKNSIQSFFFEEYVSVFISPSFFSGGRMWSDQPLQSP